MSTQINPLQKEVEELDAQEQPSQQKAFSQTQEETKQVLSEYAKNPNYESETIAQA